MTDDQKAPENELAQLLWEAAGALDPDAYPELVVELEEAAAASLEAQEPVAYLRKDQLVHVRRRGPMLGQIADSPRVDMVPLYAYPQTAPDLLSMLKEPLEMIANMDSMSYHSLESAKITARAALTKYNDKGNAP